MPNTVTIYAAPVGSTAWTAVGTRSGDGSLTVPLDPGPWWLYAADSSGQVSTPVQVLVTDGTWTLPTRCRASIAAAFAGLGLTNPLGGKPLPVVEQLEPDETKVPYFPCVLLTTLDVAERNLDTKRDDLNWIGYPTRVSIVTLEGTPPDHRNLPVYESWRFRLMGAVRDQALDGVPEVSRCVVDPNPVFNHQFPRLQHLVSEFVVWANAATRRGVY